MNYSCLQWYFTAAQQFTYTYIYIGIVTMSKEKYVHSCLQLVLLFRMSTNTTSHMTMVLECYVNQAYVVHVVVIALKDNYLN